MTPIRSLGLWRGIVVLVWVPMLAASSAGGSGPEGDRLFREKIEPVLKSECYRCHSAEAEKPKAGLFLDTRAGMLKGGDTGAAVVPGNVGESLLIQAIRHEGDLEMPPKKPKLTDPVIADFEAWVKQGAPDPRTGQSAAEVEAAALLEARRHWAFQPVQKPEPPRVKHTEWVRSPIDAFIVARLEERGWQPAPPATREEWLRRASFDLTGLPPTPEAIDDFLDDPAPDAYEHVVDRLLNSPRYGERWAQHWLDVVRFAETEGYEYDRHIPDAWRFRDYVIRSLNDDKPIDRFITEQLAGDEIAPGDLVCETASIFHRLGPVRRNAGNPDIALSRNEVLTERTDILGTAFLGLTVGCARCHNHKLEPISQKDYYRFQAFLAATDEHNISLATEAERTAWEASSKKLKGEIQALQRRARQASGEEKERLNNEI
jgi:mono/diheme cytochrome c family protein